MMVVSCIHEGIDKKRALMFFMMGFSWLLVIVIDGKILHDVMIYIYTTMKYKFHDTERNERCKILIVGSIGISSKNTFI